MNNEYCNLINIIFDLSNKHVDFLTGTQEIETVINKLSHSELMSVINEIGMIPESIEASSTEEKLFSKASDCVLAKALSELGLKSAVSQERSNSADIIATSVYHGYSLVADAKTFRLSRTAKNQKDFKISTLSNWRGSEHDFALLVAPYFQYPKSSSQIYSSALDHEVCLISWEHILFLLENEITETPDFSLESIWSAATRIARNKKLAYADRMNCHLPDVDEFVYTRIGKTQEDFMDFLIKCKSCIIDRGNSEVGFLNQECQKVKKLTREEAISELIKNKKFNEKISTISKFISALKTGGTS